MRPIRIRFRIDFDELCSVGFGKIELLEAIERTGSLSQAAREIGMSYRRAWLLVDSMNTGFDRHVIAANVGGSGGGGATLTDFGRELIATFRELEPKLAALTQKYMQTAAQHVVKRSAKARKAATPGQRKKLSRSLRTAAAE